MHAKYPCSAWHIVGTRQMEWLWLLNTCFPQQYYWVKIFICWKIIHHGWEETITVVGGKRPFLGTTRKAFEGLKHWRMWWGMVYLYRDWICPWVSNVPSRHGDSPTVSWARTRQKPVSRAFASYYSSVLQKLQVAARGLCLYQCSWACSCYCPSGSFLEPVCGAHTARGHAAARATWSAECTVRVHITNRREPLSSFGGHAMCCGLGNC